MKNTTHILERFTASDLFGPWHPMRIAPRDGTEIECLVYHRNRRYAKKSEKTEWTDIVKAHWTDHNGGGWVWMGMMGQFRGWRPNSQFNQPELP